MDSEFAGTGDGYGASREGISKVRIKQGKDKERSWNEQERASRGRAEKELRMDVVSNKKILEEQGLFSELLTGIGPVTSALPITFIVRACYSWIKSQ